MKNFKQWIFIIRTVISIIAVAVTVITCSDGGGGDSAKYWLISSQKTYTVTGGIVDFTYPPSETNYDWISYHYSDETNYEEEYFTKPLIPNEYTGFPPSEEKYITNFTYYHYTRVVQNAESETITADGTVSVINYIYDLESGLTKNSTSTNDSGVTTGASYVIQPLDDSNGVKTYKYYLNGSTWYNIYKIQNGRTLETRYYNADNELVSTTMYTQPDNAVIRAKLPNFTLYSSSYLSSSYSINSSHQTAEVVSNSNSELVIRVRTFNDNVLSSQTDSKYKKINPNEFINNDSETFPNLPSSSDYVYLYWRDNENSATYSSGDFEGSSIVIIGYKGNGSNVTIPAQIKGKPVTSIEGFKNPNLISINIPNSVTHIGGFKNCTNLTSINIPNSVTCIRSNAFENCIRLTSVTIPDSVTIIGWNAFENCIRLTSVTIPNGVTYIQDYTFVNCIKLTSVTIPNGVTCIGHGAFGNCIGLTSITIPDSLTISSDVFSGLTNITSVTFQGTINVDYLWLYDSLWNTYFDLREKYLAGGIGTYTRESDSMIWTKN